MRRILFAATVLAATACMQEGMLAPQQPAGKTVTFTAMIGDESTRTTLGTNEEGKPQSMWTDGDRIMIHNGTEGFEFATSLDADAAKADFTYSGDDFTAEDGVIAVYPYGDYTADLAAKTVTVSIPSLQHAVADSYDPESAVAVAYSTTNSLRFSNVPALLKFTIGNSGVKNVIFTGLAGECVAGPAEVVMTEDGSSIASVAGKTGEGMASVTLSAGDGYFETGRTYYMAVLPQALQEGFVMYFQLSDGGTRFAAKVYEKGCTLKRNVILNIGELGCDLPESSDADPILHSMKFEVRNNPGKILGREFTHKIKSSFLSTSYDLTETEVEEKACSVDQSSMTVSLYVPYLNDRRLVPTFETEPGTVLLHEGRVVESGVTEIDFTGGAQLTVVNGNDESAVYTVELTNTGLPVVVVNQLSGTSSTESNSKYTKASAAWYKATGTEWQSKDAEWSMEEGDSFMVYNADGTSALIDKNKAAVDGPILASTRFRGNVTQQMPKKSFAVKLDKKHGVNIVGADGSTSMLLPHKRWVLLANWKDRTLMRNAVAFGIADVFRNTLSGGMEWNPSGQFVELVYNGVHVGNYYLCEQIKIDGNRLDINDPLDEKDNPYTGKPEVFGYLMESDDGYDEAWQFTTANYVPFLLKDDANADMLEYAQGFVRGIEDLLYRGNYDTAYEKMDLASFVDFLLVQELMMNSEMAHPKSCYSYINDGTMYAGPLWDFDWNTLPVSSSYSEKKFSYTESMIAKASFSHSSSYPSEPKVESDNNYIWYPMLVKDSYFTVLAAQRWDAVKAAVQAYVTNEIPRLKSAIELSESVNSAMWPVDEKGGMMPPRYNMFGIGGGHCGDEGMTFDKAVSTLQATLTTRISGMDYVSRQDWPSINY